MWDLSGIRVRRREIRKVEETRLRQVKKINLKLAPPTPLGDSITL